jgi:ribosome recycling factor
LYSESAAMKPGQSSASSSNASSVKDIENQAKNRMEKVLGDFQHAMTTIRTGRASISILDSIRVDYYGTPTPLNQVATLHVPEPALITVQPWDTSQIGPIEKAIRTSDLGLNPSNDGKIVRIPIPPLTEERRRDFVKRLHHIAEEHRVSMRNARRDANEGVKKLLKDKAISEDEDRRAHDEIQKMTDGYISKLDQMSKAKEKEIMEIK